MNILAGLYRPDEGEIRLDGRPVVFRSPRDAIEAGLGMVHQHFTLVPSQTVTENILLGLAQPRFLLDARRSEAEVARLAAEFGLRVHPAGEGLAAQRRRAAAGRDPEAPLSRRPDPHPRRADRGPRAAGDRGPVPDAAVDDRGRSERRLHQPQARRGRSRSPTGSRSCAAAGSRRAGLPAAGVTKRELARLMVGRDAPRELYEKTPCAPGRRRCSRSTDVEAENDRGLPALRGVSLDVRAGEIVGIAAVAGNGQTRARRGRSPASAAAAARSVIGGEVVANRPPRDAIKAGVAHVPEDRTGVGSAPNLSLVRQPDHEALPRAAGRRAAG